MVHSSEIKSSQTVLLGKLPPGWVEARDPSTGALYYYDESSGRSQWERPSVAASICPSESPLSLPEDWKEASIILKVHPKSDILDFKIIFFPFFAPNIVDIPRGRQCLAPCPLFPEKLKRRSTRNRLMQCLENMAGLTDICYDSINLRLSLCILHQEALLHVIIRENSCSIEFRKGFEPEASIV
ncbi:hypothetical protein M9H77_18488 [Catharanthus roseus]|uniref:Uncharacterized protein n=1 Tax=Catharanthus roseus TaxID=4058 RepID=A0ACC0B7L0_CATRO|nr:hypothetical protein M9H77_18488 [Catharanthus roseus]